MYKTGSITEELKSKLMDYIQKSQSDFKPIGEESRRVIYYGDHSYTYTGHKHEKQAMPAVISELLEQVTANLELEDLKLNSCLVTEYSSGVNHIPLHRDDEPVIDPESKILTVSIGTNRKMIFVNNDESQSQELVLEDSSVLVTSRYAQDFWRHGIPADESTGMRVSFTFRNIAPYFLNSTKILGDSNSSKINFGIGSGTLGAWVPGQRVKAGHIEALPEATEIGPYRNLIIHTGINSINSSYHRKSNSYLLHVLESKCKEYLSVYPRLKIHISTLLPTRVRSLNRQVDLFNQSILDMCYNLKNVYIIDNSIFGNVFSDEYGRWNVNEQKPFTSDILHLGKKGIRRLAVNFKSAVLNSKSQSRSRFNVSNGQFSEAFRRNMHRDGYQSP
jgi:alkylated DNA repair dioxygenase AlkB